MQSTYLLLKRHCQSLSKPAKALVAAIMAVLLAFTLTPISKSYAADGSSADASAISVLPTNYYGIVSSDKDITILSVSAPEDTTLYINAQQDGKTIAQRYPWSMKDALSNASNVQGEHLGVVSLKFTDLATLKNDGGFEPVSIQVYSSPSPTSTPIFTGTIYPVYGQLGDSGKKVVLGATTIKNGDGIVSTPFNAPQTCSDGEDVYTLQPNTPKTNEKEIVFPYVNGGSGLVGTITYVDREGVILKETPISLANTTDTFKFDIPATIDVDEGEKGINIYRTFSFKPSLEISFAHMDYTIMCAPVTNETIRDSFDAIINFKCDGVTVLSDSVTVLGTTLYTLPQSFVQNDGDVIKTYTLAPKSDQNASLPLNAAGNVLTLSLGALAVEGGNVELDVEYTTTEPGSPLSWTIRKVAAFGGGDNRPGNITQPAEIETKTITIAPNTIGFYMAEPIDYNGTRLVPFGKTTYTHAYNSNSAPITTIYYVPEDYTADQDYDVTVQYVNLANGEVIKTRKQTIYADTYTDRKNSDDVDVALDDTEIGPEPESFDQNGVTYVRLGGQSMPYFHAYMSNIRTYTVFYRDINDTSLENVVIKRTHMINTNAGTEIFTNEDGVREVGLTEGDPLASIGAEGGDAAALYGMDGLDTNEGRLIADDDNPLARATNGYDPLVIGAAIAVLAIAAVLVFILIKRRTRKEEE